MNFVNVANSASVSIIVPCYNAERFLLETFQKVRSLNSYRCTEIIAIDDGSTDRTAEIIRSYGSRPTRHFGPMELPARPGNQGTAPWLGASLSGVFGRG